MGFRSTFGGRLPGQPIAHSRSRGVVVKARVARHKTGSAPLPAHLRYLRREGVTKEGEPARMFDGTGNERISVLSQNDVPTTGIISGSSSRPTTLSR
jgi:hypothetical protein